MKVFAHCYDSDETGNNYRWRTLLQFGTSWDILGSVVMKNPGSAEPHYMIIFIVAAEAKIRKSLHQMYVNV